MMGVGGPNLKMNTQPVERWIDDLYKRFDLEKYGLSYRVFRYGMLAYLKGLAKGIIKRPEVYVIIDFTKPSNKKRMYILDMVNKKVLDVEYVAHGRGRSGRNRVRVEEVSNEPGSHLSPIGFFVTGDRYIGKHGLSLRLIGVENGFNDNTLKRSVVIHGAGYVSEEWIRRFGRLGRSWGCFAVDQKKVKDIVSLLEGGIGIFVYFTDERYLRDSEYLKPVERIPPSAELVKRE